MSRASGKNCQCWSGLVVEVSLAGRDLANAEDKGKMRKEENVGVKNQMVGGKRKRKY